MEFYDSRRLSLEGLIPSSITNLYQVQASTSAEGGNLPSLIKGKKLLLRVANVVCMEQFLDKFCKQTDLTEEMLTWMIMFWYYLGFRLVLVTVS